ncbi:MAG: DUF4926 domain-containing protein [Candidatus Latescibacteria bacterium]|nr:DUF4926 domain-containing protein [Candidatus Latescibacterota bacterium]
MNNAVQLLDVVALTTPVPEHRLERGEIGTVVECHPGNAFEVEFVAEDGYTYALVTLSGDALLPLRQKRAHSDLVSGSAAV